MTTREIIENFAREEGITLYNSKKTDKEIYDMLVKKGLTDSFETFTSEVQKIFNEKVSKMSSQELLAQIDGAELTDDQLEMIAGGKFDSDKEKCEFAGIVLGSAAGAVAAAGAAGAAV